MRNFDFLQADLKSQLPQFIGDILDGSRSLGGADGPWTDVVGKVGELPVGVVIGERGIPQFRQFVRQP